MKYEFLIPLFAILLFCSVFAIASFNINSTRVSSGDSITYHSNVCVYKNGELVDCSHNLLYNTGKNLIRTYLGDTGGGTDEIDQIEMCDSSIGCGDPQADASETYNAYATCGLSQITGDYNALEEAGNWTISTTFTSTCDNTKTNMTRLKNTAGTNFAGVRFTDVILQTDDQLLVNWTLWVE